MRGYIEGCTPPLKKVHTETRLQSSYFSSRAYGKAGNGNGNGNGNGCGHLPYNVSFSIGQKDIHLVNALE